MREGRGSWFAVCEGLAIIVAFMFALAFIGVPGLAAQEASPVVGDWTGTLNPGGQPKKHVVVHISAEQDGSLRGTIDYPDQSVSGVQITAITYRKSTLHFESTPDQSAYDGIMDKGSSTVTGVWKQGAASLDLILRRIP
jgi:hypothetical protein